MKIGKLFEFEGAHIVRNCSSKRCSTSIHGHSYKLELVLEASSLDAGAMVYDFGLLKREIKQLIDAFDHSICLWRGDLPSYIEQMQAQSERWILLPFNVSAEMLAALFFTLIDAILRASAMQNAEADVRVHSVRLNETRTGWAQAERTDCVDAAGAYVLGVCGVEFSPAIVADFGEINPLEVAKIAAAAAPKTPPKLIINPKIC